MESAGPLDRARVAFEAGRYEEARELLRALLEQHPRDPAVLRSLSVVSTHLGESAHAFRYAQQAIEAAPQDSEAHFALALLYLLHGNYEKGFIEYEWRLFRENCVVARYAQGTFWDGRPLQDEALMLHCEQGFGDNLQFIRFLQPLRERVKTIYLACHPELVRLFSGLEGLTGIVTDGQPLPPCAYHCPLLSLPRIFKTTLATLPRQVPYLPIPAMPPRPAGSRPRIGIIWRANRSSPNSAYRSIPLADLRVIADDRCQWISLQRDPDADEEKILHTHFRAEQPGRNFRDFEETAACVQSLDLVVTVDTSLAHVAGGLGKPAWVLLPRRGDWRWLLDRSDSPWYPTLTLFRQSIDRDWTEPLRQVRENLYRLIVKGSSDSP